MQNHRVPWEQKVSKGSEMKLLQLCGINPEEDNSQLKLMDFGCGNGRFLEVFAKYLPKQNLYGGEIASERVNEVRVKGFNCTYLKTGNDLPFDSEYFDIVFSTNVIEHIPRKHYLYYLAQVHRVLKKGGRFVIGTPNYPAKRFYDLFKAFQTGMFKYYLLDDPTHCNKLSIQGLETDLRNYFDEVYLEPTYILFEKRIRMLKKPKVRKRLRFLGDKVSGFCLKK